MKLEVSRQIFEKFLKYQISWKSVQWEPSCFMGTDGQTDGRTDRHDEANSRFSQFANAPKNSPSSVAEINDASTLTSTSKHRGNLVFINY
jgi:hypothetical protein